MVSGENVTGCKVQGQGMFVLNVELIVYDLWLIGEVSIVSGKYQIQMKF